MTAGDLKSESSVNKLINLDEGFWVLRNLRGSPPYFERCKKDVFAMIRQLGNPTWFCSFSAAALSETDLDENGAKILKEALGRIRSLLNSINADEAMTFVEFLEKLDLSQQRYIKALRLSLKHSTLLLK